MNDKFTTKSLSKAERRLLDLGISHPSEIDLEAIAWDEGVEVRYEFLDGCEARLIGIANKAIVTIRNSANERRQRFSLAHELGHWNFHRGKTFECRIDEGSDSASKNIEEREADEYAADLLMPEYMFKPMALSLKRPDFNTIEDLSNAYNTSLTATAFRVATTSSWPVMLVCHNQRGRAWYKRSKDIPDKWIPKKELDPDSIAFDRLFGKEPRVRAQKIPADVWFGHYSAKEFELYEDAIHISDGVVLTLLWFSDADMLEE